MAQLPPALIHSLETCKGFDKSSFEKIHQSGEQVTSVRINPFKLTRKNSKEGPPASDVLAFFKGVTAIPWTKYGFYLDERPSFTFDPYFHAGCYYVQEASSMFLEQALLQTEDLSRPLRILDLSAAPGGKSTHILSLISPNSFLVSNDVIRSRANILTDNIIKWGSPNVVVTNNDPRDWVRLKGFFDIIVVDAPCSGSGLFRRDPAAIEEWSLNNVGLCSQRQQRILSDVWPALKSGGLLVYSTCSYSKEEDEEIVTWMNNTLGVENISLNIPPGWGIIESGAGYRFWPDKLKGEGFFIACLRKKDGDLFTAKSKSAFQGINKQARSLLEPWVRTDGFEFIKYLNTVYAWPTQHLQEFTLLLKEMRVVYSGTRLGEIIRDKMVPSHPLAMSNLIRESIPAIELDLEQAINFLKRKDIKVDAKSKGWQLATYQGYVLGWVNVLTGRINNYYPKELRILKEN